MNGTPHLSNSETMYEMILLDISTLIGSVPEYCKDPVEASNVRKAISLFSI